VTERHLTYMRVDELPPAPKNPKGHSLDEIEASMDRFGFIEPVLLDERTGKLVGGHGRLEALGQRWGRGDAPPAGVVVDGDGTWLVPVVRGWSSADDREAEAALVALNQLTTKGGWADPAGLHDILDGLRHGPGLDGVGFTPVDVDSLLASIRPPEPPEEFPAYDESIETKHECPRCGYTWS
jgi:hypothetical protein